MLTWLADLSPYFSGLNVFRYITFRTAGATMTAVVFVFLLIVLIRVVFSFVSPFPTNPISRFAWRVTEPVLAPIRRLLPAMGGLDLSPLVVWLAAIILIQLLGSLH